MTPELLPERLATERLVLGAATVGDADELHPIVLANLPRLVPWLPWAANEPTTLDDRRALFAGWARERDEGVRFEYVLRLRATGAAIGMLGAYFRVGPGGAEIGYWLDGEHEGRGLVTEATLAMTWALLALDGVHRVQIHADPENRRSTAVPRRLGFAREGLLRSRIAKPDGTWRDTESWCLVEGDPLPPSPLLPG